MEPVDEFITKQEDDYRAFVTGSRRYGHAKPDSDLDLVVLVDPADLELMRQVTSAAVIAPEEYKDSGSVSMRFGNLNLICTTRKEAYDVWLEGTEELEARKPVLRDDAIKLFQELRYDANL
jgi:predicted nucleotidyltransferase